MSWFIAQSLANDTLQRHFCASAITESQPCAQIIPEIEFCKVAVQVLLRTVLVHALHAALENAEIALNRVAVDVATHILALTMAGEFMAGKVLVKFAVLPGFIGHHGGLLGNIGLQDGHKLGGAGVVHMEGADFTAAFHKAQDGALVAITALLRGAFLHADKGLIRLHNRTFTTHRGKRASAHGFADALAHKPASLYRHAKHAGKLVAADAFLAAAHQEHRLQPDVQLDMAALEHSTHGHAGLLAAGVALIEARTGSLTPKALHPLKHAAMRADRTVRPHDTLQLRVSSFFVLEIGRVKNAHTQTLRLAPGFGKYNIAQKEGALFGSGRRREIIYIHTFTFHFNFLANPAVDIICADYGLA